MYISMLLLEVFMIHSEPPITISSKKENYKMIHANFFVNLLCRSMQLSYTMI